LKEQISQVKDEIRQLEKSIATAPLGVPPDDILELREAKECWVKMKQIFEQIQHM
jgi:hypothetical protein